MAVAEGDQQIVFQQRTITGPLPDPETLKGYDDLSPGAADRIFKIAERDQQFLHAYQLRQQKSNNGIFVLGQIFGFFLGMAAIIAAVVLTLNDKSLEGGARFLGAMTALIGTAIWANRGKKSTPPPK